jgi:carboxylesterase
MRWQDWLATIEDGYAFLRNVCETAVLIGFSIGGALSLIFASGHAVTGVIAMATPYELPRRWYSRILQPILVPLSLVWKYMPKGPPDWRDPEALKERVAYTAYPLRAIAEVDELLRVMHGALRRVSVPVLLMHSREDDFAHPSSMPRIYDGLASRDKTMVWIDRSNHIITCDISRELVFSTAASFVDRITGLAP